MALVPGDQLTDCRKVLLVEEDACWHDLAISTDSHVSEGDIQMSDFVHIRGDRNLNRLSLRQTQAVGLVAWIVGHFIQNILIGLLLGVPSNRMTDYAYLCSRDKLGVSYNVIVDIADGVYEGRQNLIQRGVFMKTLGPDHIVTGSCLLQEEISVNIIGHLSPHNHGVSEIPS